MGFQIRTAELRKAFQRAPEAISKRMRKGLVDSGNEFVRAVQTERFTGYSPGRSEMLKRRTGFLRRSVGQQVTGSTLSDLSLRVFTAGANYAALQEFGGTVKPKRSRFLTIPTKANLTAGGDARYPSARDFINSHKGQTFFLRRGTSLLLMWNKPSAAARKSGGVRGKDKPVAMFRLVRSVAIPPRFGFGSTWEKLATSRRDRLQGAASAAVREVFGG